MARQITMQARRELVQALQARYQQATRPDKARILDQLVATSGYHRKTAVRILNGGMKEFPPRARRSRPHLYNEAVHQALIVLWEASDRVCGKRLKALLPTLLPALERHGHLKLDALVRTKLGSISATTIDRLLRDTRSAGSRRRVRRAPSALQRSVPVRTFADWKDPAPGYLEIDLVAHCGEVLVGSFVYTLSLTDVASGWTECVPLLVRESHLVIESIEKLRGSLPFLLRGLDTDNGSEFLNEALITYCAQHSIELTRSRPYHKNDQAWIEQKNGSVVRKLVGYRRFEGLAAVEILGRLYAAARLFVNFFQPSFKLKEKIRTGARVVKHYHDPQTPCARLLSSDTISEAVKARLRQVAETLDPLQLLDQIREAQRQLVALAEGRPSAAPIETKDDLARFLTSLSSAWRDGEVRPTHQANPKPARHWRTRKDSFAGVWPTICGWLADDPDQTGKHLLARLQRKYPDTFPNGQLRTLQRRLQAWRQQMASQLVFGGYDANLTRYPTASA